MTQRLPVTKTYKLFIGGAFPRSESGRSLVVCGPGERVLARICRASRKDLREAVEAARAAQPSWWALTPYNRGQVIYRMAEMLEGRAGDFAGVLAATSSAGIRAARREVEAAVDRLLAFAGWADKFAQVLGCQNAVAGPYYNFTVPEPTGVVAIIAPQEPPLLGLLSMVAPPLCAGNALVVLASESHPLPAVLFAEVCATSDLPAGAVNLLTGLRSELLEVMAAHRDLDAIAAADLKPEEARVLQGGAGENVKRVRVIRRTPQQWFAVEECQSPWTIEPFVEMKTIWHPSAT
jgi:acyl-CoA reductase-like NAD-dependent aldehyde dehydrogenase